MAWIGCFSQVNKNKVASKVMMRKQQTQPKTSPLTLCLTSATGCTNQTHYLHTFIHELLKDWLSWFNLYRLAQVYFNTGECTLCGSRFIAGLNLIFMYRMVIYFSIIHYDLLSLKLCILYYSWFFLVVATCVFMPASNTNILWVNNQV